MAVAIKQEGKMSERIDIAGVQVDVKNCSVAEAKGACRTGVFQCVFLSSIETSSYSKEAKVICTAPVKESEAE